MCNIAGYVGTRQAAPILIDMMRRQEGLAGGYYTGIATVHEGRLYSAKLTGDTDRLVAMTKAASLPGTVGILHSRSKSGGGDAWAHPFIGMRNGIADLAYVANGTAGIFKPRIPEYSRIAEKLIRRGYAMPSRVIEDNPRYQKLSDGSTVHMSDVMCQLIQRNLDEGALPVAALEHAFLEMPSEIVGLVLTVDQPDRILWSRVNYPMNVAYASHGAYLASAALAFPEDAAAPLELAATASGEVFAQRHTVIPYGAPPVSVAPMTARVRAEAYTAVCDELRESRSYSELAKLVKPLFDSAECCPTAMLVYDILYSLRRDGRLLQEVRRVDGAADGIDAPKFYFSIQ